MINKVIIAGNITREIETKDLPNGGLVARVGIAVNEKWKDAQDRKIEEAYFFDCVGFGSTAKFLRDYGGKGRKLFVEGRLKQERWEEKETGTKRSATRIVIERAQFLDWRESGEDAQTRGRGDGETRGAETARESERRVSGDVSAPPVKHANDLEPEEDDIPF